MGNVIPFPRRQVGMTDPGFVQGFILGVTIVVAVCWLAVFLIRFP